jgi:hypothetical protein
MGVLYRMGASCQDRLTRRPSAASDASAQPDLSELPDNLVQGYLQEASEYEHQEVTEASRRLLDDSLPTSQISSPPHHHLPHLLDSSSALAKMSCPSPAQPTS